jgi:hypothetical protein
MRLLNIVITANVSYQHVVVRLLLLLAMLLPCETSNQQNPE